MPGVSSCADANPQTVKGFATNRQRPTASSDDSLVRNRDTGCRSEMPLFATVPVPNGPKLSDSLVNNPLQVNRTFRYGVPFWTALEPPKTVERPSQNRVRSFFGACHDRRLFGIFSRFSAVSHSPECGGMRHRVHETSRRFLLRCCRTDALNGSAQLTQDTPS